MENFVVIVFCAITLGLWAAACVMRSRSYRAQADLERFMASVRSELDLIHIQQQAQAAAANKQGQE